MIRFASQEKRDFDKAFSDAYDAVWNKHWRTAGQMLGKYAPEHGRYYDAALLLRAKVAIHMEELYAAAALYDEFAARRPEFAAYISGKKALLGKKE